MYQSFKHPTPLHLRHQGQTGLFTPYSLDLSFPVVNERTFFFRLRYTMQGLSEGLVGILLVVRHFFHKTGFKLHVRENNGGRTIDEEGMISIA